jgi:hypothetical protein
MPNRNTPETMGAFYAPPEEPEPLPPWSEDGPEVGIGVWPGMPEKAYRAHSAAGHSDIRHWIKPRKLGRVGIIGSATHTLALEGRAALDAQYLSIDEDFDLRTAAGKERAAELVGDSGKELLRHKERALVERMFAALGSHDVARRVLTTPGENEVSLIGKFEGCKQEYKARLDIVREKALWDLKTTNHVNEQQWLDSEVDFGYINQAEWYSSLYAALTHGHLPFVFVCVSKREPHNVWVRRVPNQLMALGRKWREDVLTLYERYIPKEMRSGKLRRSGQTDAGPAEGPQATEAGEKGGD